MKKEEKRFFNFAWAPFCDAPPSSLGWLGLAHHQVLFEHVQIQELQPDKSLSFLLSTFGSLTSARGLILVNVYDGYRLDDKYRAESEGPCVPTMVVSRRTGAELLGIVREHGRDVEVRVHGGGVEGEEGEGGISDDWDVVSSPRGTSSWSSLVCVCLCIVQ